MRKILLILFSILITNSANPQENKLYQTGITAEQNLKAIGNLNPNSSGGSGFDTRYEGVKGSPRLFDTLLPSFLKVKGQEYYLQLATDIDVIGNSLLFINPKTGKLVSIPSDNIIEVIVTNDETELTFQTTEGKNFEKDINENKFFQVIKDGTYKFIKMPGKKFIEANYKGGYNSDRRYDEYKTNYKYYIMTDDSIFHQIKLNKKSLIKLFPDKKEIIIKGFDERYDDNIEKSIISLLEKFY